MFCNLDSAKNQKQNSCSGLLGIAKLESWEPLGIAIPYFQYNLPHNLTGFAGYVTISDNLRISA